MMIIVFQPFITINIMIINVIIITMYNNISIDKDNVDLGNRD